MENLKKQFPDVAEADLKAIYLAGQKAERGRALRWIEFYTMGYVSIGKAFAGGEYPSLEALEPTDLEPVIDQMHPAELNYALFGRDEPIQFSLRFTLLTGIFDQKKVIEGARIYQKATARIRSEKDRQRAVREVLAGWKKLIEL